MLDEFGGTVIDAPVQTPNQPANGRDEFGGILLTPPAPQPRKLLEAYDQPGYGPLVREVNPEQRRAEQAWNNSQMLQFQTDFGAEIAALEGRGPVAAEVEPDGTQVYRPGAGGKAQVPPDVAMALAEQVARRNGITPEMLPTIAGRKITPLEFYQMNRQKSVQQMAKDNPALNAGAATLGTMANTAYGLMGVLDPSADIREMQSNTRDVFAYDPNTVSGFTGEALGNVLPMAAGAGTLGATATALGLGASQFGQVRLDVGERRARGEQITPGQELSAAALTAAAEFLGERVGIGSITSVAKSQFKNKVANAVLQYAKAAGINASEEVVTQIAQNAVESTILDKQTLQSQIEGGNQQTDIMRGVDRAAALGAVSGVGGRAINDAMQFEQRPAQPNAQQPLVDLSVAQQQPAPVEAAQVQAAPTPQPVPAAPQTEQAVPQVEEAPDLPPRLAAVLPKYRQQNGAESVAGPVEFADRVEKALYIANQPRQGRLQQEARDYLFDQIGLTQDQIITRGKEVNARVDAEIAKNPNGNLIQIGVQNVPTPNTSGPVSVEAAAQPVAPAPQPVTPPQTGGISATPQSPTVQQPVGQPDTATQEPRRRITAASPATDEDVATAFNAFIEASEAHDLDNANVRMSAPKTREQARLAKAVFDATGRKVQFVDGYSDGGFRMADNDGVVFVGTEAKGARLRNVLAHELWHDLQYANTNEARALQAAFPQAELDKALRAYVEQTGWQSFKKTTRARAKTDGDLDNKWLESGAELVGSVAENPQVARKFLGDERSMLRKFVDQFIEFFKGKPKLTDLEQSIVKQLEAARSILSAGPAVNTEGSQTPAPTAVAEAVAPTQAQAAEGESTVTPAAKPSSNEAIARIAVNDPAVLDSLSPEARQDFQSWLGRLVEATAGRQGSEKQVARLRRLSDRMDQMAPAGKKAIAFKPAEGVQTIDPKNKGETLAIIDTVGPLKAIRLSDGRYLAGPAEDFAHSDLAREAGLDEKTELPAADRLLLTWGPRGKGLAITDAKGAAVAFKPKTLKDAQASLRPRGALRQDVADLNTFRKGGIAARTNRAQTDVERLANAVKQGYGVKASQLPPAENIRIFQALQGAAPLSSFPAPVQEAITRMRDRVDEQTKELMASGTVSKELADILGDNIGKYLNRAYRIFTDSNWVQRIPLSVRADALLHLEAQLRKAGDPDPVKNAPIHLEKMLEDYRANGPEALFRQGKLGSKTLDILKARKNLPQWLRDVMGEIKSPYAAYANSIAKQAAVIENQKFLEKVKKLGLSQGWLFEDKDAQPGYTTQIAAPDSSSMAPLNGMRTDPDTAKAFAEFNDRVANDRLPFPVQVLGYLNSTAKLAKTVFSLSTQAVNAAGQPIFHMANGITPFLTPNYWKALGEGGAAVAIDTPTIRSLANKMGGQKLVDAALDGGRGEFLDRLYQYGILGNSVVAEGLRGGEKAPLANVDLGEKAGPLEKANQLRKAVIDKSIGAYQKADDWGRIVTTLYQLQREQRADPTATTEQLWERAALRVNNTMPTASKVPDAVKAVSKYSPFCPFCGFFYESVRTYTNNVAYALQDLKTPNRRREGAERLIGSMAVATLPFALQGLTKAILGIDDEEEEVFRELQPEYRRNNQFTFINKEPGKLDFVDTSRFNPYAVIFNALEAMTRPQDTFLDKLGAGVKEVAEPLTSEQIFANAMFDLMRNRTESGRQVYNVESGKAGEDIAKHLLDAMAPGTVERVFKRGLPAMQGRDRAGEQLDTGKELVAELTGWRVRSLDYQRSLGFAAKDYAESLRQIQHPFLTKAGEAGTMDSAGILQAYDTMEDRRYKRWQDFRKLVAGVQRAGVEQDAVISKLREFDVPDRMIASLLSGQYVPYAPNTQTLKDIQERRGPEFPIEGLVDKYRARVERSQP